MVHWVYWQLRPLLEVTLLIISRSIIGSTTGGLLARPCLNYPDLFAKGTIWERFPYLLPNLFSAATVFVSLTIGILFLEETHAAMKHQRDRGLEIGDWVMSFICCRAGCQARARLEKQGLLVGHLVLNGRTVNTKDNDNSTYSAIVFPFHGPPRAPPQMDSTPFDVHQSNRQSTTRSPRVFTKAVILQITSYGILAL